MLKDLCFEIIKKCPNNCLFCSSCSSYDATTMISYDLFTKTIDHLINQGGIEEISISGGEPLLHRDLLKMIMYCKSKGIRTVLFTSGIKRRWHFTEDEIKKYEQSLRKTYSSYLDEGMPKEEFEKLIDKLMQRFVESNNKEFDSLTSSDLKKLEIAGLDKIVFDFQAWNKEIYNRIMGTANYYSLFLSTLASASCSSIDIDIHYIPTKINYKELPDLIEMLNVAQVSQLSILNFVPQGRGKLNKDFLQMNDKEFEEFIALFNKEKDNFNGKIRVGIPLLGEDSHLCTAGLSKMVIKYDGTILPCPAFKEYDTTILNAHGIKTPNIYESLEDIRVHPGTRKHPLCKQLYNFTKHL